MENKKSNQELRLRGRIPGLLRRAAGPAGGGSLLRAAAALAVLCGGVLLSGCVKEPSDACGQDGADGEVVVGFRPGTLTIAGASSGGDGWNSGSARNVAAASSHAGPATRADVPPAPDQGPEVENPDGLPAGTTFRVLVYNAGDDPQEASPVAQNTYKVTDDQGAIVSTAVDELGNATEGATHEIVLRRGAYDFYYFSPAVAANTAMPQPGTYTDLTNGADYMALAHREVIDPSKGNKHYIPEVCFYRMGSYIDVRISPREGEVLGTLEVSGEGMQLWGLPKSGFYEVGEYPYRLSVEGNGGMVEFSPAAFAAEADKTATVSTIGARGGRAVLPGYCDELKVKVTCTSDGKQMKLDASLAGYVFEPGYRYVVELGVGRISDKPTLDIEILPWNEYNWDEGEIGGGYLESVTVTPAGDIPGEGKAYTLTLTGLLPADGVEVRAAVNGTAVVTGKATASGTGVELAVPANTTGAARTVVFEYLWNGTWVKIGDERSQEPFVVAVGELYGGGVCFWVNPDDPSDFRVVALDQNTSLQWGAGAYVLGSGAQSETARNGADVWKIAKDYSDKKTNGATGTFATDFPAFSYCYEKTDGGVSKGTWYLPSKQELLDLYDAKGSVESVITANGGTAFSADSYWSATEYSSSSSAAWSVSFSSGGTINVYYETNGLYVRCVRGK